MKKQKGSPTGSGPNEPSDATPSSPESPQPKTKREKSKVQPIRVQSESGPPAFKTKKSQSSGAENDNGSGITLPNPEALTRVQKLVDKRDRINEAIVRLKVKVEDVEKSPPLTDFIRTNIRGGLKTALRAMRFADDDVISAFLKKYDSIPEGDRERIPWEAVVISAKINVHHLLGAINFAVQQASVTAVKFIAVSNYPAVMKKTVQYAKDRTGERDRATLHQGLGFTPTAKGPTFIGKAIFGGSQSSTADDDLDDKPAPATFAMEENVNNIFPNSQDTQQRLVPIRHRLTGGSPEAD